MRAQPRRYLVIVGGTWETRWGLLGAIVHQAPKWTPVWVDYPASYGTPEAYHDSEDRGITSLILALRTDVPADAEIAVLGFSQGAAVVEKGLRFMHEQIRSPKLGAILARIRYVGLCGNPYRAAGDQIGPDPGGFGVIGPLALKGEVPISEPGRWQNFALPGDLICSCPPDSLIRAIYPFTRWMSVQTPQQWAADVLQKNGAIWLMRNVPEFRDPRKWPLLMVRLHQAAEAAYHYQNTGIHGQYAVRRLADNLPTAGRYIVNALEEITWQST